MIRTHRLIALATLAVLALPGAANAGSPCCACPLPCAVPEPFYIVNQGPTYSGPGIVVMPGPTAVDTMPAAYPYVGRDYYVPHYPYYRKAHRTYYRSIKHRVHYRHVVKRRVSHKTVLPLDPGDK